MSRGVLLGPQDIPRQRRIYVPPGYQDEPRPVVGKCLAPGCEAVFYAGQEQQWQDHTVRCGKAKLDEIRALAPSHRNRGTVFADDGRDLEIEAHFRKVRARIEADGDYEVKPNERAGFS